MNRVLWAILSIFILPASALSSDGLKGPEWTFTNPDVIRDGKEGPTEITVGKYLDPWLKSIKSKCPNCDISYGKKNSSPFSLPGYIVTLPNNYWFQIGTDPFVFEVTAMPLPNKAFRIVADRVQDLVFDSAEEAGLIPHDRIGGGHIHLDIKTHFKNDRLLIRNFVVDLFNHPELFMGALSHNYLNAPPLAILGLESQRQFEIILEEFDKGRMEVSEFFKQIKENVYLSSKGAIVMSSRFHAVTFTDHGTIEVRGLQPQTSVHHYELITELLNGRIDKLSQLRKPIPYQLKDYSSKFKYEYVNRMYSFETLLPTEQIIRVYRSYIEGAGQDWNDYKDKMADKRLLESPHSRKGQRPRAPMCRSVI